MNQLDEGAIYIVISVDSIASILPSISAIDDPSRQGRHFGNILDRITVVVSTSYLRICARFMNPNPIKGAVKGIRVFVCVSQALYHL